MNSTGSTRTGLFKSRVLRLQAGIAALIGAFVLIGWHIGYTPLIQWAPGLTPMAYTTALSFVILGVAMLLMSWERERALTLLASSVAGLSLLTLTEYAAGNSIGIDRILPRLDAVPDVIRMAPNTAVCLLLISVGLVTRKRPQSRAAG